MGSLPSRRSQPLSLATFLQGLHHCAPAEARLPVATTPERFTARTASAATSTAAVSYTWGAGGGGVGWGGQLQLWR